MSQSIREKKKKKKKTHSLSPLNLSLVESNMLRISIVEKKQKCTSDVSIERLIEKYFDKENVSGSIHDELSVSTFNSLHEREYYSG